MGELLCDKCRLPLVQASIKFSYLGTELSDLQMKCPNCGMVFIPEELALGKMLQVEKALEDK